LRKAGYIIFAPGGGAGWVAQAGTSLTFGGEWTAWKGKNKHKDRKSAGPGQGGGRRSQISSKNFWGRGGG